MTLSHTFIKYTACNKPLVVNLFIPFNTLTYECLSDISLLHEVWEHLVSVPVPKNGFPWAIVLDVTFSGVLYPQMRPPTKQASRFRSTARTSRPSLTNWDLVWPLVFKLLCHVSSNWYLMFSLLPSNLEPLFCSASSFCVCPKNPCQPVPITSVSQSLEQNQVFDLTFEGNVLLRCYINTQFF